MTMHSESIVALAALLIAQPPCGSKRRGLSIKSHGESHGERQFPSHEKSSLSFQTHSSIHFGPSSVEREVDICLAKSSSACRISNVCAICLRDGENKRL
ncbi:hypothetical protein HDK90DRAFT_36170 [Phyllosticta capitalensis]|uniref:Secreted protein n=1 Tax=Phyllosticta capitalensis TaxID=121624 RepID=A0ABR1Z472_9PEZI